jgi:hypothetical protein
MPKGNSQDPTRRPDIPYNRPSTRSQAALAGALAVAVGLFAFIVLPNSGSSKSAVNAPSTTLTVDNGAPVASSPAGLSALASRLKLPIYWAGLRSEHTLELSRGSDGSVHLRYLQRGTPLGVATNTWLTVITYPEANPYAQVTRGATRAGAKSHRLPHGVLVVTPPGRATDVYFASPHSSVLVEVYDPIAGFALREVLSGRVRPVG